MGNPIRLERMEEIPRSTAPSRVSACQILIIY